MKSITVHYEQKPIYDIVISESFDSLLDELNKLNIKDRRALWSRLIKGTITPSLQILSYAGDFCTGIF